MEEELEVLVEVEKELNAFKEDEKSVYNGHTKEDFEYLFNKIAFVVHNNRCKHCKKLLTYGDWDNFECGGCGYSILESLKNSPDNPDDKLGE